LKEIDSAYKASATNKKAKEGLLHNIKNIINHLNGPLENSTKSMQRTKDEYRGKQLECEQNIMAEKDHYKRI